MTKADCRKRVKRLTATTLLHTCRRFYLVCTIWASLRIEFRILYPFASIQPARSPPVATKQVAPRAHRIYDNVLTAVELSKRYAGRPVIDGWSCEWPKPGVHLIAGANGVGKSTLLGMLAGALVPDAGEVRIGGVSLTSQPGRALRRLAYCPADCPVFPFLAGEEWLAFVCSVRGGWNTETLDQLTEAFRLRTYLKTNFGHMSLGTARKFLLLGTVAAEADVLILDEPSNALDAASLAALQATLRRLAETRLILMSCHQTSQHAAFGVLPENTVTLA